ncbi:MAG: glycosyl transferase [Spirochaetaceae bacterium]|nr:glycosyl transferase [Spirochaetaceae bacterium]
MAQIFNRGGGMIPKTIHYCWLSGDPVPEKFEYCMKTWHEKLDGYEFVLWNFDRFDINSSIWVKQAFEAKKYPCAADYIRLFALYNYGGVYMDMDVEAVRPFGGLLNRNIMLGYEDNGQRIEAGCFGAEKGHPFIKKCLDYHEREFNGPLVLPIIMRDILDESFANENYDILPSDYFSAKSYVTGEVKKTKNTRTIHHYTGSWFSEEGRKSMERRWKYFSALGDNVFSRMLFIILDLPAVAGIWINRVKQDGFLPALKYYWNTYIISKRKEEK